jgi:hypothetical protein
MNSNRSFQVQYNSFNPYASTLEILILWQLRKIVPSLEVLQKASKSVATSTIVVSLDFFSPTLSTSSAVKMPDPQLPGPSASLVETEQTPESTYRDPDTSEPAGEGHIQIDTPLISCATQV